MSELELTQNQREYLAWKIMASALGFIDQEVILADLHPGGGQYDCLSLISIESEIILMLNREGSSAASNTGHVENIWNEAITHGIRSTTMDILTELDIFMYDENDKNIDNSDQVLTCKRMARWVQFQSEKKGKPTCCWIDDTYYVGPATSHLEQVEIPPSWKAQSPPYKSTDWSAWLFSLTIDEKVVGMINMKTGEAINPDGTQMQDWYKKSFPIAKKITQKPNVITFPNNVPSDEVLSIFRKVHSFNGYAVFGDGLSRIADSVAEKWHKSGVLPDDVEQIKGALFFEFRRAHHSGDYPEGNDLRYVRALGDAIDRRSMG